MAVLLPVTGRLSDKVSPRFLSITGMVFITLFMFMYTGIQPQMTDWDIIVPTLIRGIGMSLLMSPVMVTAMNSVPNQKSGTASSLLNIIGQIAGAIGIAVLSTVLHTRTVFHLASLKMATATVTTTMQSSIQGLTQFYHNAGFSYGASSVGARSMMSIHLYHMAAVQAFQDAFWVGFWMMVVSFLPLWLMPSRPTSHGPGPSPRGPAKSPVLAE